MSTVLLRNTHPLGYVDVPALGREGDAPHFKACERCHPHHPEHSDDVAHVHDELVDEDGAGSPGVGCLIPGEEFECPKELADQLLEQDGNFELVKPPAAKKAAAKKTEV